MEFTAEKMLPWMLADALQADHPQFCGLVGAYFAQAANFANGFESQLEARCRNDVGCPALGG